MFNATLKACGPFMQEVIFSCGCTALHAEGFGASHSEKATDDDTIDTFACKQHEAELDGLYPDYQENYPMYDMDGSLFQPGYDDGEE